MQRPSIFEYLEFRSFIRDTIEYQKFRGDFSVRKFAKAAGLNSPSYVKMIVDGERTPSPETVRKLPAALELDKAETKYFVCLLDFHNSKTLEEQNESYLTLRKLKGFKNINPTIAAQYEIFRSWYTVAVLEALNTSWRKKSESQMAEDLNIELAELKRSLKHLEEVGLIEKDPEGQWCPRFRAVETPHMLRSMNVRNLHREMLKKALECLEDSNENRDISGLTIALSEQSFKEIRDLVANFRKEINAIYLKEPQATGIYQINIQLFPLLKL